MSVSIIVPTLGLSQSFSKCLEAIQMLAEASNLEIIVVIDLNARSSLQRELKSKYPTFKFFKSEHPGVSSARNLGLKNMNSKCFILIDDDCIVGDQHWLNEVKLKANDRKALHGGKYKIPSAHSYWARVYNWINDQWLLVGSHEDHQNNLLGGFLFGTQDIAKKIHFDPQLKWGGEEPEMIRRLKKDHGVISILDSNLYITHLDQSGFFKFLKRAFFQGLSAGENQLISTKLKKDLFYIFNIKILTRFAPGIFIFYLTSRTGLVFGKILKIKKGIEKRANSSPEA